jgi:hypothetical protein
LDVTSKYVESHPEKWGKPPGKGPCFDVNEKLCCAARCEVTKDQVSSTHPTAKVQAGKGFHQQIMGVSASKIKV